jgi:hypothetical protein
MRLHLYYQHLEDRSESALAIEQDILLSNGLTFEEDYIEEHRKQYDHNDPTQHPSYTNPGTTCFCELAGMDGPGWPKLYGNYRLLAAGWDAIKQLDLPTLK